MTILGFHASHEQIPPDRLLRDVQRAEHAGFDAAMCSDHFAPWSERQGESGFAWSWLGAALATTSFAIGVVTAPGQRYHPAILAQAIATLGILFPGRFWAALGSGEAMNEHITADPWPRKEERDARLLECVAVIRALLAGEEVSHDGLVRVDRAQLWSMAEPTPPLYGAAVSAQTAGRVGEWADGLITVAQRPDALRAVLDAANAAGRRGPRLLQIHLSWAATEDEALGIAEEQWRTGLVRPPLAWDLDDPRAFDQVTALASPGDVRDAVMVSANPADLVGRIAELVALGFDEVYLHHVGSDQDAFLEMAGERLLPDLREATA